MITLRVVSYNGRPPAQIQESTFDELGGSLGRADTNALVLPDPKRYVSRIHARIAYRAGGYVIRNVSTASPVQINGAALESEREARLAAGDRILIGEYLLEVLPDIQAGGTPEQPLTASSAPASGLSSLPKDDPLALFGQPATDPFAEGPPPAGRPQKPDRQAYSRSDDVHILPAHETIPTSFDPFAEPVASISPFSEGADPQRRPPDRDLGPLPAPSQNIDQLFGLRPEEAAEPFPGDHPLAEPSNVPERAASLDPLVALGAVRAKKAPAAAERDDAMEIHAAFTPPPASFPEPPACGQKDALYSWDETGSAPSDQIRTVVVPAPVQADEAAPHAGQQAQPARAERVGSAASASPPETVPAVPHAHAAEAELLRAFLAGAGVSSLPMPGALTPESMNMVGQLLRASTQGMLDLLLARALIKREIRAEVTMIVARENNPLKFSPSVEVALAYLLSPRGQGFMDPAAAITDACNDLRAHQFGVMAGMRAALDGVLRRFDPGQLEQRLTEKSIIDTVVPMHRKAKLWELFTDFYGDLTREAQDDFHNLFGREFLRAYEAQLDKLDKNGPATPGAGKL